ncbi:MAG: ABC transporter permease [Phycisphaerales bacterium]|nr:ABC transporter permease [Phycisphaerales bacterium]
MPLPLSYTWRNLLARRLSSGLTFLVVAVVVFVLSVLLSFAAGMQASLKAANSPVNIVVLKAGASAESTSIIWDDEVTPLAQTPGVATNESGGQLLSRELSVQAPVPRRTDLSRKANVPVRGVDDIAFGVHPEVRITEGRSFVQGQMEAIVGRAARGRFANLEIGDQIALGRQVNRLFRIVGVFEANGSALESEIWAPRTVLTDSYRRTFASSVHLRLSAPSAMPAALDYVNGPSVQLRGKREGEYYEDLNKKTREIVYLASILIGIMSVGAAFAVANTMYAAVDARRREIAMLRTIGFARRSVISIFMIESVLLTAIACAAGLTCAAYLGGMKQDYLSDKTWTVFAFELKMTPQILAICFAVATTVGVIGAVAPAGRAARTRILDALRKA